MYFRSPKEWARLYVTLWRPAFAHLPKDERVKLVRGCKGRCVYDSHEEAAPVIERLPLKPGLLLGSYDCPLCGSVHLGNRKHLKFDTTHVRSKRMETKSCQ